jgi:hypothetical protein
MLFLLLNPNGTEEGVLLPPRQPPTGDDHNATLTRTERPPGSSGEDSNEDGANEAAAAMTIFSS